MCVHLSIFSEKTLKLAIMFVSCDLGELIVRAPGGVRIAGNGLWLIQDNPLTLHELLEKNKILLYYQYVSVGFFHPSFCFLCFFVHLNKTNTSMHVWSQPVCVRTCVKVSHRVILYSVPNTFMSMQRLRSFQW